MGLEVKIHELEKFVENFSSGNEVEGFLEERGIAVDKTLSEALSKGEKFIVLEEKDDIKIIVSGNSQYIDSHDNPLDEDNGFLTFKKFRNPSERDNYVDENQKGLDKKFFLLDRYSHGADHYSIAGTTSYPDRRWDVAEGCAVIELGEDAISMFRAFVKKHGKDEGSSKMQEYLNVQLDSYSNYINGHGYELKTITIDNNGEVDVNYGSMFFQEEDMNSELKSLIINHIGAGRIQELSESIKIEPASNEDLKGFAKNVMRKDSISQEVMKFEDLSGIEQKVVIIGFPNKLVAYSNAGDFSELEEKKVYDVKESNVDSYKDYVKKLFVNSLFVSELKENVLGNTVLKDQTVDIGSESTTKIKI